MFQDALASAQTSIGAFLTDQLARLGDDTVAQGMRYASDGGKRLRGFLVLETAGLFGVPSQQALYAAAAVECVHAYSLVHDDLPCMDDDDLRRGRPTVHKAWDEATAVLVGDALQTFAFELLTDPAAGDADQRLSLIAGSPRPAAPRAWSWARRRTSRRRPQAAP
jgi:farnesyl diphosphate synthase